MDSVEEALAWITSIKNNYYIVNKSITYIKEKDDIVDEVEEPRDTSASNRPNKMTKFEKITKPAKIVIDQDNLDLYVLSGLGSSLVSITPDKKTHYSQKREKLNTSYFDCKKGTNPRKSQPQKNTSRGFSTASRKIKSTQNVSNFST